MAILERTWSVRAPLEALVAALAPERTPELHPLVKAVEDVRPDGGGVRFTVVEEVPLGPFRVPNRYEVRWERVAPDEVRMEAWSKPGVYLRHDLRFASVAEGVTVAHTVRVEAPFGLRGFVESTAKAAHDRWVLAVQAWAERYHPPVPTPPSARRRA